MDAGVLAWTLENGDENEKACFVYTLFMNILNTQNAFFYIESLGKNHP